MSYLNYRMILPIALASLCLTACAGRSLGSAPVISVVERPVILEPHPILPDLMTLPEVTPPPIETWGDAARLADYYSSELSDTRKRFGALVAAIDTRADISRAQANTLRQSAKEREAAAKDPPKRKRILGIF